METAVNKMGFVARMSKNFKREGQGVQDFGAELKELTRDDMLWFVAEFNRMGEPTDEPAASFPHSIKRS